MTKHFLRSRRKQSGQSLVEFALTLPVTLLVMFGLMGFAYLFYAYVTMNLAVRDAASYIVHNASDPAITVTDVQNQVRASMVTLDPSQVTINVSPSDPAQWVQGVRVSVIGNFSMQMPAQALGTINFQAQSVMTVE